LADWSNDFGSRITGSPALERSRSRGRRPRCETDSLDEVRLEPVDVAHWVRGRERAAVRATGHARDGGFFFPPLFGGSVGTRVPIRAPLVVFDDLDALRASTASLDGVIAFVNHRMPPFDEAHNDPGSPARRAGAAARRLRSGEARRARRAPFGRSPRRACARRTRGR